MQKKYNPFWEDLENKQKQYRETQALVLDLEETVLWYKNTSLFKQKENLRKLTETLSSAESDAHHLADRLKSLYYRIAALSKSTPSAFNPLSWFNSQANEKRKSLEELEKQCDLFQERKEELDKKISDLGVKIKTVQSDISHYQEINYPATCKLLEDKKHELYYMNMEMDVISKSVRIVDEQLAPLVSQISLKLEELENLERTLLSAEGLERRLNNAESSYERKLIHDECRAKHGTDKPSSVVSRCKREIIAINRNVEKLEIRAKREAEKYSRSYSTIVIDGNNMCYEGSRFIGLSPILSALKAMRSKRNVLIVFDASIRRLLSSSDEDIQKLFGQSVKLHIVSSKQKADETIIELASRSRDAYILSNDRFAEYFDKEPVRNNRIIRHEIFDGSLMIHELEIHESY